MTASTSTPPAVAAAAANPGILPGFGGVFRKEVIEWLQRVASVDHADREHVVHDPTAMNAWIQDTLAPIDPVPPPVLDPFTNVAAGVSAQMFVVIAIFVTMSLIVGERESGTLAWTASKPVSRGAIWLAKWTSATGILWLLGVILPLVATAILVTVIYGPLPGAGTSLPSALAGDRAVCGDWPAASTVRDDRPWPRGIRRPHRADDHRRRGSDRGLPADVDPWMVARGGHWAGAGRCHLGQLERRWWRWSPSRSGGWSAWNSDPGCELTLRPRRSMPAPDDEDSDASRTTQVAMVGLSQPEPDVRVSPSQHRAPPGRRLSAPR